MGGVYVSGQVCDDVGLNRDFAQEDKNWVVLGNYTKAIVSGMESGNALSVSNRISHWSSPSQSLNPACFLAGETYAVSASMSMSMNGEPYLCQPGKVWGKYGDLTAICPTIVIKITNGKRDIDYVDVGKMVSPFKKGEWNRLYGTFTLTAAQLQAESLQIMIWKVEKPVDYILDGVSIDVVGDPCEDLIKNGGGETGDALHWMPYSKQTSEIGVELVEETIGEHSLIAKTRMHEVDGIQTDLNPTCLLPTGLYSLTAKVRMTGSSGLNFVCDPLAMDYTKCPVASVVARNSSGPPVFRQVAASVGASDNSLWHDMKGTFNFFESELSANELSIVFNKVDPEYNILIEDVALTKIADIA